MDNNDKILQERLEKMKNFYLKVDDIIDSFPEAIPENLKNKIKEGITGDAELKELMEGIDRHRPPRFFLLGRTGVGKSSLVNAICNAYVADVNDVDSCTDQTDTYQCRDGDRVLMEILDSRGFAETESLNQNESAEEHLIHQLKVFSPDVALFIVGCMHRDDIQTDVNFLKKLSREYQEINKVKLPILVVINRCDEMPPATQKNPAEYPKGKLDGIFKTVQKYKYLLDKYHLEYNDIIPVSSLIEWAKKDGTFVTAEEARNMTPGELEQLQIAFDGRYNIDKLLDFLTDAIPDLEAKMGLRMAFRLDELCRRLSEKIIKIFSTISAGIAAAPIPLSDIIALCFIQAALVLLIAALSGETITFDSAWTFVMELYGVAAVGMIARVVANFLSKCIPVLGSAVNAGVAFTVTDFVGKAAVAFYIDKKPMAEVKHEFIQSLKSSKTD